MQHGINIFDEDGNSIYDSRKLKMTVDPAQDPSHLDIFETSGGTGWTIPDGESRDETLWEIEHNMPWVPLHSFYIDEIANPDGRDGWFSLNYAVVRVDPALTNPIPFFGLEWIDIVVSDDQKKLQLRHHAEYVNITGNEEGVASGDKFLYRIKYMIFNQPDPRYN